jgi:hypothetical protein
MFSPFSAVSQIWILFRVLGQIFFRFSIYRVNSAILVFSSSVNIQSREIHKIILWVRTNSCHIFRLIWGLKDPGRSTFYQITMEITLMLSFHRLCSMGPWTVIETNSPKSRRHNVAITGTDDHDAYSLKSGFYPPAKSDYGSDSWDPKPKNGGAAIHSGKMITDQETRQSFHRHLVASSASAGRWPIVPK